MEKQSLAKGQSLTYIRGHPNEAPIMSTDGSGVKDNTLIAAQTSSYTATGSPKASGSPSATSTLPKWVEQDKKVRGGDGAAAA